MLLLRDHLANSSLHVLLFLLILDLPPLPIHPLIPRIKSTHPIQRPRRRLLPDIILRSKLDPTLQELKKPGIINPRPPFPISSEPRLVPEQNAAAMRMLSRDPIRQPVLGAQRLRHPLREAAHLAMKRHVLHREPRALARSRAAIRDALDLNERRPGAVDEGSIARRVATTVAIVIINVEALDEGEPEYGALLESASTEDVKAREETSPGVAVEGTVDAAECLLIAGVDGDVQLRDLIQRGERIRVLRIADEKGRNMLGVHERQQLVDARVEDGLAHQAQRTVPDARAGFDEARGPHAGDAAHHADLLVVRGFDARKDEGGRVRHPAPGGADRVRAMAPTEDAFVGAAEGRGAFHAEVGCDAVEGVFVAGAATAQRGFGPAADPDAAVRADDGVALFGQGGVGGG